MTIVKYKNQSGVTYAYEQTSVYDPEKKQSRPKRKYLGRVDPDTGEIISTAGRKGRPPKAKGSSPKSDQDGTDYQALAESLSRELRQSREQTARLQSDNERLLAANQHLVSLLQSIQHQIKDTLSH